MLSTHSQLASAELPIKFYDTLTKWQNLLKIISLIMGSSVRGEMVLFVRCGMSLLSVHSIYHSVLRQLRQTHIHTTTFHIFDLESGQKYILTLQIENCS